MRAVTLLLILWVSVANAEEKPGDAIGPKNGIREAAQSQIDNGRATAISIGIVRGDQTWSEHFGLISGSERRKPQDNTLYELGSISKVFTGILLAHAVESGQLRLNQTIGSIIPRARQSNPAVADSITLRHLSTHSAGLPRMPTNWNPAKRSEPYADYDRTLLVDFAAKVKPFAQPGKRYLYSNVGVGMLGELLAIHSKTDYGTLLKQTITQPLKMTDTCVKLDALKRERLATPHRTLLLGFGLVEDTPWEFDALAGAGGIRSTTTDMIRFLQAAIQPPKNLLGDAIDLSWQEHSASIDGANAMGLGWIFSRDKKARWHNGMTGGYSSMILVNRNTKTGVVVLSNTSSGAASKVCGEIYEMLQK